MIGHRGDLILLSYVLLFAFSVVHASVPTVNTRNGTLAGLVMQSRRGRDFISFRGIPYAVPPLGELRFQAPKPANAWDGVRSAQEDAAICTQRNLFVNDKEIRGIEDCLYLNVYTPKVPSDDEAIMFKRFPVMIWFHGGGWFTGAAHSEFYGPKFLLDHDVVLVTANFRLGALGFLSTEDMECPGNAGMKDQVQSIRWVHENIAAFGGDPNRVTIFGESAGGASVHYHMMSPLSQGLFHRAISQSGTAHGPWALSRSGAKEKAKTAAKYLDCPTENSKELIACLRTKNASDITDLDQLFQVFGVCPMIPFRPVIEPKHPGAFLTEDPVILTKHGRIADIPWMIGTTSEEGSLRVPQIYGDNGESLKILNDDFKTILPITLLYGETCLPSEKDKITRKIHKFYFDNKVIDESNRFKVIDMYSDSWFTYSTYTAIQDQLRIQSSPVYMYYFSYKGSASFSKIFGDPTRNYGVSHADDLQYLFPVGEQLFRDTPLSKEDHHMIDVMTILWFNFANSGNPTPNVTAQVPVKWKSVKMSSVLEYLYIGNSKIAMEQDYLPERIKFWNTLPILADLEMKQTKDEL